jgi:hypothetical protein
MTPPAVLELLLQLRPVLRRVRKPGGVVSPRETTIGPEAPDLASRRGEAGERHQRQRCTASSGRHRTSSAETPLQMMSHRQVREIAGMRCAV